MLNTRLGSSVTVHAGAWPYLSVTYIHKHTRVEGLTRPIERERVSTAFGGPSQKVCMAE